MLQLNFYIGVFLLNFKQIRMAIYSLYLTNRFGLKLKNVTNHSDIKKMRVEYSQLLLSKLNINVKVTGLDKFDPQGQYLLLSNHRSIIDPCIIEAALKDTDILGFWVAKKELYYSFFFGMFVRNGGSILLDRNSKKMSQFFKAVKNHSSSGGSVFVFPEGTRNKKDTELGEFKEGSQIIAVKNKLPMLPVYIRTNANAVLHTAINKREKDLCIEVEFGDVIDYKDRTRSLEQAYRESFFKNKVAS